MKAFLFVLFAVTALSFSIAQTTININGVVKDDSGNPIQDALVQAQNQSTKTNSQGQFNLTLNNNQPNNARLRVIAKGFQVLSIPLSDQTSYNLVLYPEEVLELENLILTSGYGTAKLKEEVVGSITTLTNDDIQSEQSFESIDKMLDGQVAGLLLNAPSEIGTPTSISIRGPGTLTRLNNNQIGTSTQPLFIVDGIILSEDRSVDNEFFDGRGEFGQDFINPLARIPAEDIQSINVLKDAAAVGIYGADAANGVIIITTKKGRKSKPKFNAGFQYGVSQAINKRKFLSGPQYAQLYNLYRTNNNQSPFQYNGVDVDWFNQLNKTGSFFKTSFNVGGGFGNWNYRLGLNYLKTDEAQVGNEFNRLALTQQIGYTKNKLAINVSNNVSWLKKDAPNSYYNFILAPIFPVYDANGNFSETGTNGIPNPLAAIEQNINQSKNFSALSSIQLSYQFLPELKIQTQLGIDYNHKENTIWLSGLNESGRRNNTFTLNGQQFNNWGRSTLYNKHQSKWNWSTQLYFDKNVNQHHLDALVGIELRSESNENVRHFGAGYIDYNQYRTPQEADNNYNINTYNSELNGRSLFSQVNYDFGKKYFFLANLRRDESSAFGTDKNVAWNGGLGVSWVLSKEQFFDWAKFLRLRFSYGITGNSRIGSYRSAGLYTINNNGYQGGNISTPNTGAPPNSNLGWEENEKWNLGLDVNVGKVNLALDFFRDNRSDMIVSRDTPYETGYSTAEINGAAMYNQGVELTVDGTILQKKKFKWSSIFTMATLSNKVTGLAGLGNDFSEAEVARAQKIGASTTAIWGYKWAGVDPATGRNLFHANGQVFSDDQLSQFTNKADWQIIGNTNPDVYGGWTNNLSIGDYFTFSFLINYQLGQDILIEDEFINKYTNLLNRNLTVNALDYWQQVGDVALNPRVDDNNSPISNSTRFVYDGSFVKLQNISLQYRLPMRKIKDTWLQSANLFINVTNVAYWYKSKSPDGRNGVRELRFNYPEMRTVNMGVNLSF